MEMALTELAKLGNISWRMLILPLSLMNLEAKDMTGVYALCNPPKLTSSDDSMSCQVSESQLSKMTSLCIYHGILLTSYLWCPPSQSATGKIKPRSVDFVDKEIKKKTIKAELLKRLGKHDGQLLFDFFEKYSSSENIEFLGIGKIRIPISSVYEIESFHKELKKICSDLRYFQVSSIFDGSLSLNLNFNSYRSDLTAYDGHLFVDFDKESTVGVLQSDLTAYDGHLFSEIKPFHDVQSVDFDKESTVGVLQREYAVTAYNSNRPILGSFGAGPCLIVAIYDSQAGAAFLAHIDAIMNLDSLKSALDGFSESSVVYLYGGECDKCSINMRNALVEIIKQKKFTLHNNTNTARSGYGSASLAINACTGKIYSPVEPKNLTMENLDSRFENLESRFESADAKDMMLTKCYDGYTDLQVPHLPNP